VADVVRVAAERADAERRTGRDLAEGRALGELVLAKLGADQPDRELRAVDRNLEHVAQCVGQRADVILVRVRNEEPADLVLPLPQVCHVRDDEVDAQHPFVREHETGIDDDDVIADLDREHVLANFTDAA